MLFVGSETAYARYEIVDRVGRVLRRGQYGPRLALDLPSGVYFLKLIDAEGMASVHVIAKM